MKDLFLSEWCRLRTTTLIAAVAHGLLLLFLSRVTDLMQLSYGDHGAMLLVYLLLGLTLALVQVGSYRKPSQWLWLLRRPMAPERIFFALALSALMMLSLAVLLPLLLFVLATDLFTTQVVDSRHYVALIYATAFSVMAWMAGTHASVSRSKASVAILFAPLLLAVHMASVWWLLPLALTCVVWMTLIAMYGFRANRDAPISRHGVLLLTALPLQLGFFLLIFQVSKAALELVQLTRASRHSTTVLATAVDAANMQRSFNQDFMIQGLRDSKDSRASSWREQLPLLDVVDVVPDVSRFPVRHQISNLGGMWVDKQRLIEWDFSHDKMMFLGRDPNTGAERGWWGATGAVAPTPFAQVPLSGMTPDVLYAKDDEKQEQYELLRLPDGESFVGRPISAFDRTLILTTKRLLAYRKDRQAPSPFAPLQLDWEVPLPASAAPVAGVAVSELMDGWLVSIFHFPGREFDGFENLTDPWQQIVFVDGEGVSTPVNERHRIYDHSATIGGPPLVPASSWWVSPLLFTLAKVPDVLLDKGMAREAAIGVRPPVTQFYAFAAASSALALFLGFLWLRRTAASASRRGVWLASCLLLGLPALCSLICLEPRKPYQ